MHVKISHPFLQDRQPALPPLSLFPIQETNKLNLFSDPQEAANCGPGPVQEHQVRVPETQLS